jgi:hypothetical protein
MPQPRARPAQAGRAQARPDPGRRQRTARRLCRQRGRHQAAINTARTAEIAKLGPTAPARVDAVINWLTGMDGSADKGDAKALAGMLVTARHVEAFERIINKVTSQGTASFSQSHRVAPDAKIPGYET